MRTVTGYPGSYANMEITHLSLFSGIGGLDLAAEAAGCITIGQCEWAEYPTKVLEKHWPDVPRWRDIRELTGESFYGRTGRRTVDIISGGFPCQPFSVAGKQRGKEDDRYLWPEMVRVIKELRPTWVVGENVAGIVRMALSDILSELEACGYRTRTFLIPACAVGALHRRYRVAIVGYSEHDGLFTAAQPGGIRKTGSREQEGEKTAGEPAGTGKPGDCGGMGRAENLENPCRVRCGEPENVCEQPWGAEFERAGKIMADTKSKYAWGLPFGENEKKSGSVGSGKDVQHSNSAGCEKLHDAAFTGGKRFACGGYNSGNVSNTDNWCRDVRRDRELPAVKETGSKQDHNREGAQEHGTGERWSVKSGLGGMVNGFPDWMDGYWDVEPDVSRIAEGVKNRVGRLKALGNAVVPQQFFPVFKAIVTIEQAR